MIPCPRCQASAPNAGTLAGHLATDHLISPSEALRDAQRAAREQGDVPPTTTTPTSPEPKESPMPSKPKPCKYCARFAPKKCKRHGGEPRSTAFKATGQRKGAANGHRPPSDLAAAIRALRDTAEAGKRAQAELDEIEALLARA